MALQEIRFGTMLGGGGHRPVGAGAMQYYLALINLDRPAATGHASPDVSADDNIETIPCGFLVHGLARSRTNPDVVVAFEKHGPGACVFDLGRRVHVTPITTERRRQFYGHGAFTADDGQILAAESDLEDALRGYIIVRDADDHGILGEYPSHGAAPHDVQLLEDGSTLVVSNGGGPAGSEDVPNVAYIEASSGKLLEKVPIPSARLNAGHLHVASDGGLVVTSAPRAGIPRPDEHPGGVSVRPAGGAMRTLSAPTSTTEAMLGESLSVAVDEARNRVAVTNPAANLVTFWDRNTGELQGTMKVPNPRGVALTLDGSEFVLSFNKVPQFARIDAQTLAPVDVPGNRAGYRSVLTGSHVEIWRV